MECTTTRISPDNETIIQPKRQFLTQEEAIKHCKYMNSLPERTFKITPYKCSVCYKFHVGRNGNVIKEKEKLNKTELKNFLHPTKYKPKPIMTEIRIIGKINL